MFIIFKSLCLLGWACSCLPLGETMANTPVRLMAARPNSRIVKQFDFDEAALGNFESTPMNWRPRRGPGYPRYLEARFDADVGRTAPPSFRFSLATGSMASDFLAREIPVQTKADYEISAWILSAGLTHARAYLSACLLDEAMNEIPESRRTSDALRGSSEKKEWVNVRILLIGGHPRARWIALACHAEQEDSSASAQSGGRAIHHHDVGATAWFDDIRVVRLPRLNLDISAVGNVFEPDQTPRCRARVADVDDEGLATSLAVLNIDGRTIRKLNVATSNIKSDASSYDLGPLEPGYYTARLAADAGGSTIAFRERAFVVAGQTAPAAQNPGDGFGLIFDEVSLDHPEQVSRLAALAGPKLVKAPLWRESLTDDEILHGHEGTNRLLNSMRARGISVAATVDGIPRGLKAAAKDRSGIIDLLCAAGEPWRAHLALVFVRYGAQVQAWQFGGETGSPLEDEAHQVEAMGRVRGELNELIGTPTLIVPRSTASVDRGPDSGGDIASVTLGEEVQSEEIAPHLKAAVGKGGRCWATIVPPSREEHFWRSRIAETGRRMILARVAGAEEVLIPQPWRISKDEEAIRVEPDETFSTFRTIAGILGGMKPVGALWLSPGVAGWLFEDEQSGRGTLAAWREGDGGESMTVTVDAGSAARRFDIWGRESSPRKTAEGVQFEVDVCPAMLAPVDIDRMKTLASFAIAPAKLTLSVELQTCEVVLTNAQATKLNGTLRLAAPAGWMMTPSRLAVDLAPGQTMRESISLRLPSNQSAGELSLVGRLRSGGSAKDLLTMRAPINIGTSELAVRLLARVEDDRVHVSARITNQSQREMAVRAVLIAGGRAPEGRLISNFAAGATTSRDYVIDNARELKGRYLRLCVEEVGGAARDNQVVRIE
jgi:hypothetical protein